MKVIDVMPEVRGLLTEASWTRLDEQISRMLDAVTLQEEARDPLQASFAYVDDKTITQANLEFRETSGPTDVLAFALRETESAQVFPAMLGDVIVSVETARSQQESGLLEELLLLSCHGLCHLLGYDHATEDDDRLMKARMAALLAESARSGPTRAA